MAINFSISRLIETGDSVGCNDFQTNQLQGDVAGLGSSTDLDGDIIWYIDADTNYEVDINDFGIPNSVEQIGHGIPDTKILLPDPVFDWSGTGVGPVPSEGIFMPMLGVEFTQISATRIKITIYLHPTSAGGRNITGPIFEMPNNDVSVNLSITGCAVPLSPRVALRLVNENPDDLDTNFVVGSKLAGNLGVDESLTNEILVDGLVPQANAGELIGTYTVSAKAGNRFLSEPNLNLSTKEFSVKPKLTKDENGNAVSKSFEIYKK